MQLGKLVLPLPRSMRRVVLSIPTFLVRTTVFLSWYTKLIDLRRIYLAGTMVPGLRRTFTEPSTEAGRGQGEARQLVRQGGKGRPSSEEV